VKSKDCISKKDTYSSTTQLDVWICLRWIKSAVRGERTSPISRITRGGSAKQKRTNKCGNSTAGGKTIGRVFKG